MNKTKQVIFAKEPIRIGEAVFLEHSQEDGCIYVKRAFKDEAAAPQPQPGDWRCGAGPGAACPIGESCPHEKEYYRVGGWAGDSRNAWKGRRIYY